MMGRSLCLPRLAALLVALTPACAPSKERAEGTEAIASSTLDRLPEDVQHRTFIDFGGKLHLVGYSVSPDGTAGPGDTVKLTLYWKSAGRLGRGWNLFTHLEDDATRQLWNFDREGSFRQWLNGKMPEGLGLLEVGKIYVDEQTLTLPKAEQLAPRVTVVVGVWNGDMRLPVLSGTSNGHEAAIIAQFSTGIERPRQMKDQKAVARP